MLAEPFDGVVIGTGFGGAVAACRLAQAGKKICILERGRRYPRGDFPRPAKRPDSLPHVARWAWAIDHGLWDVKDLQGVLAVQGAGYGGGSLVYANVHLRPPRQIFAPAPEGWPAIYRDRTELDPYYDIAAAALRVRPLPAALIAPSPVTRLPKVEAPRRVSRTGVAISTGESSTPSARCTATASRSTSSAWRTTPSRASAGCRRWITAGRPAARPWRARRIGKPSPTSTRRSKPWSTTPTTGRSTRPSTSAWISGAR